MSTVCLVSCVNKKLSKKAPARELYISPLFQKAMFYAASRYKYWYIVSTKHGLIKPETIVEPYDETLNNMPKRERMEWADHVFRSIVSTIDRNSTLGFIAGMRYREHLIPKLVDYGYKIRVPLESLSIGKQLSWFNKIRDESERLRHLDEFYALLGKLKHGQGKRVLKDCRGNMSWPRRGVYFFFESNEFRTTAVEQKRVVRIGTHSVSEGSKSTLWNRLRTHRGGINGTGNHRGSIFRLHVGTAMINQSCGSILLPTWGKGQTAPVETKSMEVDLEKKVSAYIGGMSLLWLAIGDEPSATSDRAYIEQNAIALIAGDTGPLDLPSPSWLGRYSSRYEISRSGLWNINYVNDCYDPRFLQTMAVYVDMTLGKVPSPKGSIAPYDWHSAKLNRTNQHQLVFFNEE